MWVGELGFQGRSHSALGWHCRKEERGRLSLAGLGWEVFQISTLQPSSLGPGRRRCERECHYLTQHVPKPQKRSDVYKKHVARSYLIRGISRSFLHCLDIKEVLCPYISLSLSVCLSSSNYCDLTASNTKLKTIKFYTNDMQPPAITLLNTCCLASHSNYSTNFKTDFRCNIFNLGASQIDPSHLHQTHELICWISKRIQSAIYL